MVKELGDTHKQDVQTQTSLLKTQSNLMKSIDKLTNQVADLTTDNKKLQQLIDELQKWYKYWLCVEEVEKGLYVFLEVVLVKDLKK